MASDFIPPSSFLSPLGPIQWVAQAEAEALARAANKAKSLSDAAAAGTRAGLKGGAVNSLGLPLGFLLPNLPDLPEIGDDVNKLANKALVAEVVLVGGAVALAGIAAWYFSRRPSDSATFAETAAKALIMRKVSGG